MKKIFLFLLAFMPLLTSAQNYTGKYESWTQMLNPSSVYFGLAGSGSNLDTGTNTTALNLVVAKVLNGSQYLTGDTVLASYLSGRGNITFNASFLKVTNSPSVVCTPICSYDGVHWATIPSATTYTVSPTSLTVPVNQAFSIGDKVYKYYGLQMVGSASSTYSVQLFEYYEKAAQIQIQQN